MTITDEPVSDPYKLPLPEEIAGLIERLQKRIDAGAPYEKHGELDRLSIAALRALAQENERLKAIHRTSDVMHLEKTEFMLDQKEHIRELEAENAKLRARP